MAEWITWFIALFQTCVQWLGSMQLLGVSVLYIMGAVFILGVLIRAFLYKA